MNNLTMTRCNGKRRWVLTLCLAPCLAMLVAVWPAVALAASGPAQVRVSRTPQGRITLEVRDDSTTVVKEVWASGSTVTITTPSDRLTVSIRTTSLTITTPRESVVMDERGARGYGELLGVLNRSAAAAAGRLLLSRLADGPNTFAGQSLLLTMAILESGSGSTEALGQHHGWVNARAAALAHENTAANGPRMLKVGWQKGGTDRGPGDCWDLYSIEAIRIADDFVDCIDDSRWYEVAGCSLIYAVRAEAAMFWFVSCSGGFPFGG